MRKAIKEYLEYSETEKIELWKSGVFILDTNVLLNLYRYSKETRDTLFKAMNQLKDRLWMPHHIAKEFMKNRIRVIYETIDRYQILENKQEEFVNVFKETLRLKDEDKEIKKLSDFIKKWIDDNKENNYLVKNPTDDGVLSKLLELYDGKVGRKYADEEISDIKEDGKKRYANQTPPGYKDKNKKNDINDNNMYGDLIVWKQILEYAKDEHRNIIFITDDQKTDWWNEEKGRTIGPRIELREEFISSTKQNFHMYNMHSFIALYREKYNEKIEQKVIDELYEPVMKQNKISYIQYDKATNNTVDELERKIDYLLKRNEKRRATIMTLTNKYRTKKMPDDIEKMLFHTEMNILHDDDLIRQYEQMQEERYYNENMKKNSYLIK